MSEQEVVKHYLAGPRTPCSVVGCGFLIPNGLEEMHEIFHRQQEEAT